VVAIPARLRALEAAPGGPAWLAELPDRLARCRDHWSLQLGAPYEGGHVALVLPARRASGDEVVLKLQYPHAECAHEAEALRRWDGDGAVGLLDALPAVDALLLERCRPGTPLADEPPEQALAVLLGLLPRLWRPAGAPFRALADEARQWARRLPARWERAGRPYERPLLERALERLDALAGSQPEQVLLHQDLHGGNVLRAEREPWLAIDPKPLAGERAFGLSPVVRSSELGHGRDAVHRRLERGCAALGVDRERARGWAFAHALAWGFDERGRVLPGHLETARWLDELR